MTQAQTPDLYKQTVCLPQDSDNWGSTVNVSAKNKGQPKHFLFFFSKKIWLINNLITEATTFYYLVFFIYFFYF